MYKRNSVLSTTIFSLVFIFSLTSGIAQENVLLSFDKENVSKEEFERVYQKNNGGYESAKTHTADQFQEYLDLYINFKRKVFAAEDIGLPETPGFQQEFETYRKQLARPYLSAKEVENKLIEEAYERSKLILNANHLLISLSQDPTPEDTAKAYKLISAIRDTLMKGGASFEEMATKHSTDPSAAQNKGNLGYFSVFDMVYPFETAAYSTEVGEVSSPVKTQFGYHLVRVNDKIVTAGKKRASHILIRVGDRYSAKDTAQAEQIIQELYGRLKQGEAFADLAQEYSDDPNSAPKGGDLGTGRLLPSMQEIKLKLAPGEFSAPFQTQFGWHLMSISEIDSLKSLQESTATIRQRITRDSRSKLSRAALVDRIKKEYNYKLNDKVFDEFTGTLTPTFSNGTWTPDTTGEKIEFYKNTLFTLDGDYQASLADMVNFYARFRVRNPRLSPRKAAEQILDRFAERTLMDYEEQKLPEKNPEYRYLLKEYRDGILLFTLMEQKVWKKAVEDSVGLKKFYEDHKDDFYAEKTLDVREYKATSKEAIQQVADMLKEGKTEEEITASINKESSLALRIISQTFEEGEDQPEQPIMGKEAGYTTDPFESGKSYKIWVVKEVIPAGIKPFTKAKSECITKYQDHLENEWLTELSETYPVKVDNGVFATLFK
ncbi:MAG: peptidylprolyl isomerase [Bacteroidota bacterium]